jgi:hypothetical protein
VRPTIATEFWTSISPTLATGGKAIITSTPNSDEDQFALLWKGANRCEDEYGNPTEVGVNGFKAYRAFWNIEHFGTNIPNEMKPGHNNSVLHWELNDFVVKWIANSLSMMRL